MSFQIILTDSDVVEKQGTMSYKATSILSPLSTKTFRIIPLQENGSTPSPSLGEPSLFNTTKLELYIVIALLVFFCILGTTGNAVVMHVFHIKRDKSASTLFILCLAYVDFCACLIVVPYTIYIEYMRYYVPYDLVCKLYQFLITSNIPFSIFIMVAIAIDRYFCICHPFMHAMTPYRARIIIVFMGILASSLGVTTSLLFGVYQTMETKIPTWVRIGGNETSANNSLSNSHGYETSFSRLIKDVNKQRIWDNSSHYKESDSGAPGRSVLVNTTVEMSQFTGLCSPNYTILSERFQWMYQKVYTAVFVFCLVIMIVLYILIYKSVLMRRKKRQRQKSMRPMTSFKPTADERISVLTKETKTTILNSKIVTTINNDHESYTQNSAQERKNIKTRKKERRRSSRKIMKKESRIANLKTAAMLFVVTVVFIVTYIPAFLMALRLIPYSMTVFYMYFANNVANPVIYSFMNRNFRNDLKKLFRFK